MITLSHIRKTFGDLVALDDLCLDIQEGEILGLLGPNGAGKTTCIRILCSLLESDSGRISWEGQGDFSRNRIGLCPQENIYWPKLTCLEQLVFTGEMYGLGKRTTREKANELLDDLGLLEKRDVYAESLSGGMKRRLNIALALIHDPPILVLDEPEAGLDPQSRILIRDLIKSLSGSKTIILTTHNMDEAERLAGRVAIIDHGKLLRLDTVENLKASAGEGDLLEMELVGLTSDNRRVVMESVQDLFGLKTQVVFSENRLQLRSRETLSRIHDVSMIMEKNGIAIQKVELRKSTLEDVFIDLTGRGLRQ